MRFIPILLEIWRQDRGTKDPKLPKYFLAPEELHEVAEKVRELSRGLTRKRNFAGETYFDTPEYLGAYLLYFWPISYAQMSILLGEIDGPIGKALDLGSGPGPVSLVLFEKGATRVVAADRGGRSLGLAEKIASAAGYRLDTVPWDAESGDPLPRGSFDIITLGHVLNELWNGRPERADRIFDLVDRISLSLAPGGRIIIMEPALMNTTGDLLHLRDRLIKNGFLVKSPCIFPGPCPALAAGATCHAESDWDPPRLVRDLARRSRVSDRQSLKMAYIIVSRESAPDVPAGNTAGAGPAALPCRVVSDPMLSKSGRLRYFVCGPEGRFTLSAKRAGLPPALNPFLFLRRGDIITFAETEPRENGRGLTATSRLEVVRRRGAPVFRE